MLWANEGKLDLYTKSQITSLDLLYFISLKHFEH